MSDEQMREKPEKKQNDRQQGELKRIITIAIVVFVTFCCCILFFFMIYRYNGFAGFWKKMTGTLQPIIIGLVVAYLLNPVMKFLEKHILKLLKPRMKNEKKAKSIAIYTGILGSLIFLILIIVLLLAMVIPAMIDSISGIVRTLPEEVNTLIAWTNEFAKGDSELADFAETMIKQASLFFENWWNNTVLSQAQKYVASITSGVITVVNFFIDIIVGLIVSVYVLASKERFSGQAKKITYAIFKPGQANIIVDTVRKSNQIFGGFITGKLLDSLIIGVIAYIVLSIMKMPDTILVAVVIGVTNIIPFFGPFIGAVPSFLIIVLQNPIQGLYFLIFVIVLQQIDGNIIGPKILGNSTGLSPFWVVFSILVFGGLWGFAGMILGVPLMAVIQYIVQQILSYVLRRRGIPETEVDFEKLYKIDKKSNRPEYTKPQKKEEKSTVES